jgi:potassium/chloride transporter 4/5/6
LTLHGTIDIWYILHDGGILVMLAWLLQQDDIWKACQVRVFCVVDGVSHEEAEEIAASLKKLIAGQNFGEGISVEVIVLDGLQLEPYHVEIDIGLNKSQKQEHNVMYEGSMEKASGNGQRVKAGIHFNQDNGGGADRRVSKTALKNMDDLIVSKIAPKGALVGSDRRMSQLHASIDHRVKAQLNTGKNDKEVPKKVTMDTEADLLAGIHSSLMPGAPPSNNKKQSVSGSGRAPGEDGVTSPASQKKSSGRKDDAKARATRLKQSAASPYAMMNKCVFDRSKRAQLVLMNLPDVWDTSDRGTLQYLSYCESITQGLDRIVFVHSAGTEALDFHL